MVQQHVVERLEKEEGVSLQSIVTYLWRDNGFSWHGLLTFRKRFERVECERLEWITAEEELVSWKC